VEARNEPRSNLAAEVAALRKRLAALEGALEKRAEAQVALHAVGDSVVDAIITNTADDCNAACNPAAARMFDYLRVPFVGKSLTILMPDLLRQTYEAWLKRHCETGEEPVLGRPQDAMDLRRDGMGFPFELTVVAVVGEPNPNCAAILRDSSAMKQAEAGLDDRVALLGEQARYFDLAYAAIRARDLKHGVCPLLEPIDRGALWVVVRQGDRRGCPTTCLGRPSLLRFRRATIC
jgi:PAS domain S-box-containing protein